MEFKPSVIEQHVDAIKGLENIALKDSAENATAWKLWRAIRSGLEPHADLSHEAKVPFEDCEDAYF